MPRADWRWLAALVVAVLSLMVSIGWLDVVRGRELAILRGQLELIHNRQEMVLHELDRARDRLEYLERRRQP